MKQVTLLGPLDGVDLAAEIAAFGVDGPVALVTAGWEEGERNDAEVDRRLRGGSRNLNLYGRRLDILESDPGYADAERLLRTQIDELRELYLLRLRHALAGVEVIRRRFAEAQRRPGSELDAAIDAVRTLDEAHASAIAAAYEHFYAQNPPHERATITRHRDEVAAIVAGCVAIAIARRARRRPQRLPAPLQPRSVDRGTTPARVVVRLHRSIRANRGRRRWRPGGPSG